MSEKIIVSMPLVRNIGYVEKPGWKLTNCPKCGEECYTRDLPEEYKDVYEISGYLCTQCMIKLNIRRNSNE